MLRRHVTPRLEQALSDTPVVLLHGARQTGKSTLVQSLAESGSFRGRYLTLDDATILAAASSDPDGFLAGLELPIILDEVQRAPGLFPAIKMAVDRARKPGSFLLTGSANVLFVPRVSESLAGRIELIPLMPLSQGEIEGRRERFIDAAYDEEISRKRISAETRDELISRMLRGGYPEVVTRKNPDRRASWFGSYLNTILQRDVRDLSHIEGLTDLPRLLSLLAARASGLLNVSDIARLADI
ncbi:MAG TPA: AAA family ATPase, partial [Vicinamibacteria bacterium]|nr:AAA family ATPase [Vicinamibacteria bacterium]